MLRNILFDLDGTISDSREGVIGCFQHTLKELTGSYQAESSIMNLVGIPIRKIFKKLLSTEDEKLVDRAISVYREKYSEIGITGNRVYSGIAELLAALNENRFSVYIITNKNKPDSEKVVRHLGFDHLVKDIYGPSLEGYPETKTLLIESALSENNLQPVETVMIGDRKDDIISGRSNGIRTIGVTYGFGSEEEIIEALPDRICRSPNEIFEAVHSL